MTDLTLSDIDLCLRRASQWKFVKKTGLYEASVSDFEKRLMRMGRTSREVFVPVNTRDFAFTKEELDKKDPRIAETLDVLNALYKGPTRRRDMARSLRKSYFVWHHPHPFTKEATEQYLSRLLFVGPNFKNKEDFYCIFEHIRALHTPEKPVELKPGVFAQADFVIAEPGIYKTKSLLSETDIAQRNVGLLDRINAALALQLDKYELNRFVLRPPTSNGLASLPDDFTEEIEFSF